MVVDQARLATPPGRPRVVVLLLLLPMMMMMMMMMMLALAQRCRSPA